MIHCELFNNVYFDKPQIPRSWAYLDSLDKFGFRA